MRIYRQFDLRVYSTHEDLRVYRKYKRGFEGLQAHTRI